MRTEVIKVDSIDAAVERILDELKEDTDATRSIGSRNNVIYFNGWDGLGASAVLRAVAQRLAAAAASEAPLAGLQFDQVIHMDCSKWESRRALQRAMAKQLKLPAEVMEMLDRQDEEDDYNGVAQDSRSEVPKAVREMYEHIQKLNSSFLVIFHNGSNEEIDLASFCGFPLSGYSTNKVLWTFQGRFRLYPKIKVDRALNKSPAQGATDVYLSAAPANEERDQQVHWSYLVQQEIADLVATEEHNIGHVFGSPGGIIQLQQGQGDIDCDDDEDGPWRAADLLQREMRLDEDFRQHNRQSLPSIASMPYWTSPPYEALLSLVIDKFHQFHKLGVMKLSYCAFSFSSHPFRSCHNLRILWIDHCIDQEISGPPDQGKSEEEDIRRFLEKLWVLNVGYTCCDRILSAQMMELMTGLQELNVIGAKDWDMGQLQGRLPNIRKLRVTKSTVRSTSCSEEDLFSGMNKMELLEFSGNHIIQGMASLSRNGISTSNSCLDTVIIIDGCVGIQNLSFGGCAKLKNLLLSGLFGALCVLKLSGTAIKTLDLSAMTAQKLDELYLDDCEELCAILWSPKERRKRLLKLHINTTRSAAPALVHSSSSSSKEENKSTDGSTSTVGVTKTSTTASLTVAHGARPPSELDWCIAVKDSRLLRSLVTSFTDYFESHRVHVEISTPSHHRAIDIGGRKNEEKQVMSNNQQEQLKGNALVYGDVAVSISEEHLIQVEAGEGDAPTITRTWPCPPAFHLGSDNCYLYTQDQKMKGMDGGTITMPSVICDHARILHVHDALSISSIPGQARWYYLRWCRVERCPRLNFVFTTPRLAGSNDNVRIFYHLQTFWAFQLPMARFLWDMNNLPGSKIEKHSFEDLTLLHIEFCPRLIHVLPFSPSLYSARALKILEIVWCGDLRTIFPLLCSDDMESHKEHQDKATEGEIITVAFPNLKHIHLHELPKVQSICESGRMYAPNLKTIKIRGCWSLRHLPSINRDRSDKVECDCEKEWWDRLEWDGLDAYHHHSLYKPKYSKYYKKTLLRGRVLI
ncbi:hypothetical protein U9M48_030265 [Paspalum notatum var. saurae]|uniref:Disease resistance protein At4g27190-like leucine-rich repeats domain-containing protein n=1 Tax=Paspalum notatum var. saurae TaxID=547442 RepID=A0AAQ3U010_PASNO